MDNFHCDFLYALGSFPSQFHWLRYVPYLPGEPVRYRCYKEAYGSCHQCFGRLDFSRNTTNFRVTRWALKTRIIWVKYWDQDMLGKVRTDRKNYTFLCMYVTQVRPDVILTTPHHKAWAKLLNLSFTSFSMRYTRNDAKIRPRKPMYIVVINSCNGRKFNIKKGAC